MLKLFKPSLPALLLLLGVLAPACLACNDECRLQDSDCDDDYEVCIDAEHFDSIKTHCDASAYMCQSCVRSCTTSDGTCTIQHTGSLSYCFVTHSSNSISNFLCRTSLYDVQVATNDTSRLVTSVNLRGGTQSASKQVLRHALTALPWPETT